MTKIKRHIRKISCLPQHNLAAGCASQLPHTYPKYMRYLFIRRLENKKTSTYSRFFSISLLFKKTHRNNSGGFCINSIHDCVFESYFSQVSRVIYTRYVCENNILYNSSFACVQRMRLSRFNRALRYMSTIVRSLPRQRRGSNF